jgi:hypothetical protein
VRSKKTTKLLIFCLLPLFLPAHLAIVLLSDLNFIPSSPKSQRLYAPKDRSPGKDRLRIQIVRGSEQRPVLAESKSSLPIRDLTLPTLALPSGPVPPERLSRGIHDTRPSSLKIWLVATPQNHRAPPA